MTYIGVKIVEFADKILDKLHMTSFGKALVYMAVALTVIFTAILLINAYLSKRATEDDDPRPGLIRLLSILIIALSTVIPITAYLPITSIYRSIYYFFLATIVAVLMAIYVALGGNRRAPLLYGITVILLTAVVSVFLKNHFFGNGYPYYFTSEYLYTHGTLKAYQLGAIEGGFYYFIPTDSLNLVTIGIFTNLLKPMDAFYDSLFAIITGLALVALFSRFRVRGPELGLFFLFVPPLAFLVARIGSLPYTALAFLMLAIMLTGRNTMYEVALYTLAVIDAVFAHPVGPVALTATLLIAYLASPLLGFKGDELGRVRGIIGRALGIVALTEFTYWIGTYIAMFLILEKVDRTVNALSRFITTILGGKIETIYNISPIVAPGYAEPEVRIFAYLWAFPVALSLALILFALIYGLRRVHRLNAMSKLGILIGVSAAAASVLAIGFGYADYTMGLATGQYLLPVAYLLAVIGASSALGFIIRTRLKALLAIFLVLFMIFVFLGVYSPDWAPIENSSIFHVAATVHPYYVTLESTYTSSIIPNNVPFYAQDGLPFGSQGKLAQYYIYLDFSQCNFNTLLGVYYGQAPRCILNYGDLAYMDTNGYVILAPR